MRYISLSPATLLLSCAMLLSIAIQPGQATKGDFGGGEAKQPTSLTLRQLRNIAEPDVKRFYRSHRKFQIGNYTNTGDMAFWLLLTFEDAKSRQRTLRLIRKANAITSPKEREAFLKAEAKRAEKRSVLLIEDMERQRKAIYDRLRKKYGNSGSMGAFILSMFAFGEEFLDKDLGPDNTSERAREYREVARILREMREDADRAQSYEFFVAEWAKKPDVVVR